MPLIRSRVSTMAAASGMLLASLVLSVPVAAADSPEAAVNEFFDLAVAGEFSRIGEVVCAADQDAMLEAFDFGSQLGLDDDDALASALTFEISDRSIEVIAQEGDTATVAVDARMTMSVPDDQIEALVRAILEADLGPDDPPVSDDDVELMLGFMGSAFNQTQAIEQEATVVLEEGRWLVCGGLVDEPESVPGFEPTVSTEGLCGLVSPDEMSALSTLEYDSSNGFAAFCNYSDTDFETFHSTGLSFILDEDVEKVASIYGADQTLEVSGAPAFATESEAFANQLLTQVGDDVLQVTVSLNENPPEDLDWLTQATLVTELFMPRLAAFRLELAGPPPEPTPEPTPEISLCESLPLDELNDISGLAFDDADGGPTYCTYSVTQSEDAFHSVSLSLDELELEFFKSIFEGGEEVTVGGQDGERVLSVTAFLFSLSSETEFDGPGLALQIAEAVLPELS